MVSALCYRTIVRLWLGSSPSHQPRISRFMEDGQIFDIATSLVSPLPESKSANKCCIRRSGSSFVDLHGGERSHQRQISSW